MMNYRVLAECLLDVPPSHGNLCWNPVTGAGFVSGFDPIEPQICAAERALRARGEWNRPMDAPDLPIHREERDALKGAGGIGYLVAEFAASLQECDYDHLSHPSFEVYARGVMASPFAPSFIKDDPELQKRFPPTPLKGLRSGNLWSAAK
jgi:hypothetical protein